MRHSCDVTDAVVKRNFVVFSMHLTLLERTLAVDICLSVRLSHDISFMAIFAKVTENECIIERHLRDIDDRSTLRFTFIGQFALGQLASESQCTLSI